MRFPRVGLSAPLPGGSGPKRPAGTTAGLWLITPAALGRPGVGNTRSSVVPSQEVRELELSGGVRSLPQVPRWNAGRRARPKRKGGASRLLRGAPRTLLRAGITVCVCRRSASFYYLFVIASEPEKRTKGNGERPLRLALGLLRSSLLRNDARSTSLFDIARARRARARPGSHCIRPRDPPSLALRASAGMSPPKRRARRQKKTGGEKIVDVPGTSAPGRRGRGGGGRERRGGRGPS